MFPIVFTVPARCVLRPRVNFDWHDAFCSRCFGLAGGGAVNKENYKNIMLPRRLILDDLADNVDPASIDPVSKTLPLFADETSARIPFLMWNPPII